MHFFIVPTYGCNLSCSYCFESEDRKNVPKCNELMDVYDKRIKLDFYNYFVYAKKNGYDNSSISFHGGETTLLPAKDFLYLCHEWKETYEKVYDKKLDHIYANIITNAVRFIREPEYLDELISDPEIYFSLGISFDMYSQSERSKETYKDYEELFKKFNTGKYKEKIMFGLLTQISKHSVEHKKEWLEYYEYFNNNFYDHVDNIRLKLIDDYYFTVKDLKKSYLSNKKTYKFLQEIRELQNKIALKTGKVIPTDYFERYLDLDEHICFGTCGNDINLCWQSTKDEMKMFHYYNYSFIMGCPRTSVNSLLKFKNFDEDLEKTINVFNNTYIDLQNNKCNGCKYRKICQPCPILPTNEKMYFNDECKMFMKRIVKR